MKKLIISIVTILAGVALIFSAVVFFGSVKDDSPDKVKVKAKAKEIDEVQSERIGGVEEGMDLNPLIDEGQVISMILDRWKTQDFSKVDEDHNAVWRIQGGSIGKA